MDVAVVMGILGEVVAVAAGVAAQDLGPVLVAILAAGGVVCDAIGAAVAHPPAGLTALMLHNPILSRLGRSEATPLRRTRALS